MRRLRNASLILFVLSVILFVVFRSRELSIQDPYGPEITMDSDKIEVSVKDPEEKLLEGLKATDRRDGDVTSSIIVENVSTFLRPGVRIVTYAAFDKDMHVTRAEREMHYTDYRSPEFTILKPLVLQLNKTNLLENVSVSDVLDDNLNDSIKILADRELLVDTEGDYEVRLQASNSAGDVATLPVLVHVGDYPRNMPRVVLSSYIKYIDIGEEFDPYEMVTGVYINGTTYEVTEGRGTYGREDLDKSERPMVGTRQIPVKNEVDNTVPGTYRVRYSMTVSVGDDGERITGERILYVVVRDDYSNSTEE